MNHFFDRWTSFREGLDLVEAFFLGDLSVVGLVPSGEYIFKISQGSVVKAAELRRRYLWSFTERALLGHVIYQR
jgi:hypothetical protein